MEFLALSIPGVVLFFGIGALFTAIATAMNRIAGVFTAAGWIVVGASIVLILGKLFL